MKIVCIQHVDFETPARQFTQSQGEILHHNYANINQQMLILLDRLIRL